MPSSREVNQQIRESLSLPAKPQNRPTVPIEGHLCDFPIWSYSRKRASIKTLHIDYDDGSFFILEALKGMLSPSFPGYLDAILFCGQRDLFDKNYVELSVYSILKTLGLDPNGGSTYRAFKVDMEKAFAVTIKTDRFRDPVTKKRTHTDYFRILQRIHLAKNRQGTSTFFFDDLFLESYRSGYLKRLDFDYCLQLDKENKPLARFLYSHIVKRLGTKSTYIRRLPGFLHDVGLGYIAEAPAKICNQRTRSVLFPALNCLQGKAFTQWEIDDHKNIFFVS